MPSYTFTRKAVTDLSDIWEYSFETWSEKQADKYYYLLVDTCEKIANKKISGKHYNYVSSEILGLHSGQHIIFYRWLNKNKMEVIRILHGGMDLKRRMQE